MSDPLARGRLGLFLGMLALMLAVESLRAARPWHAGRLKRLGFHLFVSVLNSALYRPAAALPLLAWAALVRERGWGVAGFLGLCGPVELAATLVVFDLLDYWWHRANHEIGFFWRFHRGHHFDTHVDTTTALRFHIGELLLSGLVKGAWVLIWGPSVLGFAVFEAAITAYAQFHHTNIDLPERAERLLRLVHMTPRLHAAHHTVAPRSRNGNYSTIFLWWDHCFGSFREADARELRTLGLREGRGSDLSLWALIKSPVSLA